MDTSVTVGNSNLGQVILLSSGNVSADTFIAQLLQTIPDKTKTLEIEAKIKGELNFWQKPGDTEKEKK